MPAVASVGPVSPPRAGPLRRDVGDNGLHRPPSEAAARDRLRFWTERDPPLVPPARGDGPRRAAAALAGLAVRLVRASPPAAAPAAPQPVRRGGSLAGAGGGSLQPGGAEGGGGGGGPQLRQAHTGLRQRWANTETFN